MSKDLNQCNFIGRLGKDVELRYTSSGDAVANMSIACGDDYKDKQGQKVEKTNWINITAYRRLAEIMAEYLHKGSKVYISGKQQTRKYQDQNGQDKYATEIIATDMQMLDSRSGDEQGQQSGNNFAGAPDQPAQDDEYIDDIPF